MSICRAEAVFEIRGITSLDVARQHYAAQKGKDEWKAALQTKLFW